MARIAAAAFLLGVLISETNLSPVALVIAAGAIPVFWLLTSERLWLLAALVAALALVGGLAHAGTAGSVSHSSLEAFADRSFRGRVLDVPRHYPTASFTRVEFDDDGTIAWATLPSIPRVEQGDVIHGRGTFHPHSLSNAPPRGFGAHRGTAGELRAVGFSVVDRQATFAQRLRIAVTDRVRSAIRRHVPEPAGAFSLGVLLGDDGAMTEATRDAFRVGGLTHMTAVSGLHTGIVAGLFLFASRAGLIHRWYVLAFTVGGVWMFAYLVGMRPSVTRASLMLTIFVLAQLLGRPRDTLNALLIASALIVLVVPAMRYDVGFQLSVAATLGIALALPFTQGRSAWHTLWVIPLAAEIAVEPLILYHFGYYSLISPFANVLAAPFVALAMGAGIVTVVAAQLSFTLGEIAGLLAWAPSRTVVAIADLSAVVPLLSGEVEPLSWTGVWIAYVILAGIYAVLLLLLSPAPAERESDLTVVYRI